jgi:hypothetical protein
MSLIASKVTPSQDAVMSIPEPGLSPQVVRTLKRTKISPGGRSDLSGSWNGFCGNRASRSVFTGKPRPSP